jgi:hypothetical protein
MDLCIPDIYNFDYYEKDNFITEIEKKYNDYVKKIHIYCK